jgi:hypothetical protein
VTTFDPRQTVRGHFRERAAEKDRMTPRSSAQVEYRGHQEGRVTLKWGRSMLIPLRLY